MASGLFLRLKAQTMPLKMYGFDRVDRDREKSIVERLTRRCGSAKSGKVAVETAASADAGPVCEKYRAALSSPEPSDVDHPVAMEEYSRALFRRLGRSHTFSSRCKQRSLDPHRMCSGHPGEEPDYQPILDLNQQPPTPPPEKQQQQKQRQGPSLSAIVGFSRIAGRAMSGRSPERQLEATKQKASPFGLVFRTGQAPDSLSSPERPVASTAVFGAIGRLRYRAKKEELQQQERDQRARELRSDWEIVNATEYVRNYERENRRDMRLAVLGRPTASSRFKSAAVTGCPFCRETPALAASWAELGGGGGGGCEASPGGGGDCPRCGRFHGGRPWTATGETSPREEEPPSAEADEARGGSNWGPGAEAALVARVRVPTRASEGGVPFCQRGRRAVGPGLGSALLGFEEQRPKSGIERVRSAQKRKELIDAMSARLHSGGAAGGRTNLPPA